ncbi:MAG TPA: type II toxin-antitoxin system HicA family toxin [Dehalococcoidia bacterium]|nr:type II toxin-antitoxin system HicA family toxin [Dehalococcoidia bacterium]
MAGTELASLLAAYGYRQSRQSGSHMRLVSALRGAEHHITIPAHGTLRVGTLASILNEVARYLEIERDELARQLFGG